MRQVKYFSTVHNSIHETGIVDLEVDQQVVVVLLATQLTAQEMLQLW